MSKGKESVICSVVVPFHKGKKYLKDCLDSLCEQTLSEIEVIVVGDRNETAEDVLGEYTGRLNLDFIKLESVEGVAAARNCGARKALGKYLYFLDSDDYIEADTLQKMHEKAKKENADLTIGHIRKVRYKRISYLAGLEEEDTTQPEGYLKEKRNWDFSILHTFIRREYYEKMQCKFPEEVRYVSDATVMTKLLAFTDNIGYCEDALYLKRYHDDPLHLPALEQMEDESRPEEFIKVYKDMLQIAKDKESVYLLCMQYCCDYLEKAMTGAMTNKIASLKVTVAEEFRQAVKGFNETVYAEKTSAFKLMLKAFSKGKTKQTELLRKWIVFRKRKNGIFGSKAQRRRLFYALFLRRLPVKENYIVFESFLGRYYSDSCRAMYEYINKTYPGKYKCIWAINEKKRRKEVIGNPVMVKRESLRYYYYVSRAKYWINNMRQDIWLTKKPGTIFLETWHGTPLKRLFFDMDEVHSDGHDYKMEMYRQSRQWDYLVSDNRFSTEVFSSAFAFDKDKILEYGYPRNDILYASDKEEIAKKTKEKLGLPLDKKVILYAPTWRDDEYYGPGNYKFNLALDLEQMRKRFSDEYIVLLRTHYYISEHLDLSGKEGFVYNVSEYGDIAELYLVTDICITDYSSVFFDFANLRRPILFYTYDFDKYKDMIRGLYIDMKTELPGPLLYTNEEVFDAIENIAQVVEEYKEKEETFYNRFCNLGDGNACKRIYEKVFLGKDPWDYE